MELVSSVEKQSLSQDYSNLFSYFCTEITKHAKVYDIDLCAISNKGINKFNELSADQKMQIIEALKGCVYQLEQASLKNVSIIGDNRKHAWWALRNLGYIPPDDLFDKIDASDIIEIYDSNSIQVFRSFELFKHISYSLTEMFSYTWSDLFERDEFVFNRISNTVADVLAGKTKGIIYANFPDHVVKEKFSAKKHWLKMRLKLLSPVYRADGSIGGLISAFQIVEHGCDA